MDYWTLLGIAFILLFGGVGIGVLYFLVRTANGVDKVLDDVSTSITQLTGDAHTLVDQDGRELLRELSTGLGNVNEITSDVATVSNHATDIADNASQLTGLVTATIGVPLVKVSAFSYGVRRAIAATRGKK